MKSISPVPDGAGLYIHIPFCVRKCAYCDFLSAPATEEVRASYVKELCRELSGILARMKESKERIPTLYFGGGTPSVLTSAQIRQIMQVVKESGLLMDDAEITLEANPGTVDLTFFREIHLSGINRISLGVQSFHEEELKLLGRIHRVSDVYQAVHDAKAAGFTNISLDLMSGLPGQKKEVFFDSLKKAADLEPTHLSVYSLIIEEGTPFYERYRKEFEEENEELDREIYHETKVYLESRGFMRYEISNYCRKGAASRHNSSYWTGVPYYGAGLGASSFFEEGGCFYRTRNQADLLAYLKGSHSYEEKEALSLADLSEEFVFLGLRMASGISLFEYADRFGVSFLDAYGKNLEGLLSDGLLSLSGDRLALTERGLDLENYCVSRLLYG